MTDRELERKLADAVTCAAPDDLDAILSRCGAQNGSVMELKELRSNENTKIAQVKPRKTLRPWLAAACAALVLLGAGGGGLVYSQSYAVASVVSLDVNPSIELTVNRGGRVISCSALNEEAAAVLFSMNGGKDLKGTKLDVAVNAIVGALVQAGYMDSISSAILISVEDSDQERAQRLQAELVASVDGVLQTQAPGTSVLSQVLTMDAGTKPAVYGEGLSLGKAALVDKVLAMNGAGEKAFDQLAALSVEELNDLLEAGEKRIPIGKSAAATAAETYAGTLALDSVITDVDPELDENPPHYEVKVKTAWGEFEYMVDAFTGEVLSGQKNLLNTTGPNSQGTAGTMLTDTQAFNVAAEHFGAQYPALSGNNILNILTKLDWENGRQVYDVDFIVSGYEFEYEVDAYTGAVLKWDTDYRTSPVVSDPAPTTPTTPTPPNTGSQTPGTSTVPGTSSGAASSSSQDVGQEAAKQSALRHAGLSASDVTDWKIEREWDDGRLEYDIEFWCGTSEYDYTIDGHSCSVLKHEVDHHGSDGGHHDTGSITDIGAAAAKAAALAHAGVSESQTTKMKVERDWDDGLLVYEVEFDVGRTEYEYTIDGTTGAILEYGQDTD